MDLDGIWYDTARTGDWTGKAQTGVFDGRSGNLDAEIWVSRIAASTMMGSEPEIVNRYFEKVHNRMTGNDTMPERAVAFYDHWAQMSSFSSYSDNLPFNTAMRDTFTNAPYLGNGQLPLDTKANWIAALRRGYEYAVIVEHGSTDLNQFNMENFTIDDYNLMATGPGGPSNVRFYNLVSCNNGLFTGPNIGTCYAIGQNGLLSLCSSKAGGMLGCYDLYRALSNGESFGDAYKRWYNGYMSWNVSLNDQYYQSWHYGMAIMGAGTLKLHAYSNVKKHQLIVYGNTGGTLSRSGRILIAAGDSTTIDIVPENRYQIDYVLVDGDTVIRKQYPKFPYDRTIDGAGRTIPVFSRYTFRNVQGDHTLRAFFSQRPEYRVTIKTLTGGFINNPPQGKPDTSCHSWSGLFYEGDVFFYSVGTLFSLTKPDFPGPGPYPSGTYRWSYDSAALAKAISMLSDNGKSISGATGRTSFSDTAQVFKDHYIVAAFEPKNVYKLRINQEGITCDTGFVFCRVYEIDEPFGHSCAILPSGECTQIKRDGSGLMCYVRDGEAVTLIIFPCDTSITLFDVLVDGVSAGLRAIVCRYPAKGKVPEMCYIRFPIITAPHDIKFIFKPAAAN